MHRKHTPAAHMHKQFQDRKGCFWGGARAKGDEETKGKSEVGGFNFDTNDTTRTTFRWRKYFGPSAREEMRWFSASKAASRSVKLSFCRELTGSICMYGLPRGSGSARSFPTLAPTTAHHQKLVSVACVSSAKATAVNGAGLVVCFRGHTSENSRFVPYVHSFVWFGLRCVAVRWWCCCARARSRPLVYVSGTQFLGIICHPRSAGVVTLRGGTKASTRALPSRTSTAQEPKLLIAFFTLLPCYHPFVLSGVFGSVLGCTI